jgi:hypothetical protein
VRLCLFVEEGCCLVARLGGNPYSSEQIGLFQHRYSLILLECWNL